ncbi:hypothetical protein CEK25_008954 [Fusarium fujikuroi]|nr:hypothetical protein CEK25_008954 [Fusarium fujikuroi]
MSTVTLSWRPMSVKLEPEALKASGQPTLALIARRHKSQERDDGSLLRQDASRWHVVKGLPEILANFREELSRCESEYRRTPQDHCEIYLQDTEASKWEDEYGRPPRCMSLPPRSKTPAGPPPSTIKPPKSGMPPNRAAH